jgi:chromosomal replication initiation ATPase DnaA
MSQLTFKFPFKATYYKEDFYVSSNNFDAYRLIESWPNWSSQNINIYGPTGCGKTHLSKILQKKINSYLIKAANINNKSFQQIKSKDCLIIDEYKNDIEEKLFYSILNQCFQSNKYIIINSKEPIKKINIELVDLKSRLDSFVSTGIDLPTDDLIRVILTKGFSDIQVKTDVKLLEYILKHINRSYEDIFSFINKIDSLSLSTGKSININLIKKVLNK